MKWNPALLVIAVLFDIIATYVYYKRGIIAEVNPLMRWALKVEWLYWVLSCMKVAMAGFLYYIYPRFAVVTNILAIIYVSVWALFFLNVSRIEK